MGHNNMVVYSETQGMPTLVVVQDSRSTGVSAGPKSLTAVIHTCC